MQTRDVHTIEFNHQTRAALDSSGERTFTGIAVPWDTTIDIPWYGYERFARGSIVDWDNAKVWYGHSDPIGNILAARDAEQGWEIDGQISRTSRGDEVYQLMRDDVINRMSIRFQPLEYHVERDDELKADVIVYTRAKVLEVSLVPLPAYPTATVTQVRHQQGEPMDPTAPAVEAPTASTQARALTTEDLDAFAQQLRSSNEDFQRRLEAAVMAGTADTTAQPMYRSQGELLHALVRGDETAIEFYRHLTDQSVEGEAFRRAYTGASTADSVLLNAWIGERIRLVEAQTPITNEFIKGTLPEDGNVLEYAKLKSNSIAVAKQENEGDPLIAGKLEFDTATETVETIGGQSELSRQVIERSKINYLDKVLRVQTIAYGNQIEARTRALLSTAISGQISAGNKLGFKNPEARKNAEWLDLIVDAADAFATDKGFALDGLMVSKAIFKMLYRLEDGAGHNLMRVWGTANNVSGELDLRSVSGELAGVRVKLLAGASGNKATFYSREALATYQSAGAPHHLADEQITNLTKTFAVYGYVANVLEYPQALLPLDFNSNAAGS